MRQVRLDADGVKRTRREDAQGVAWLLGPVVALVLLAIGAAAWFLLLQSSPGGGPAEPPALEPGSSRPKVRGSAGPGVEVPPDAGLSAEEVAAVQAAAQEAVTKAALAPSGERSGLALFPAPGTKPIRRGLVVPDDFALPPGYVRHYQTTDDGRMLRPILMFHPDYVPRDEHGEPLAVPEDRIVPPALAPPGMPLETLELPDAPP
jgi:hypothetical protein